MQQWHVYEDWTTEDTPRCFYVGKGNDDRVAKLQRNRYHADVVSLYGLDRRIVLTTFDESEALELERRLIIERRTHPNVPNYNGVGCNRTLGGQGNSGRIVSEKICKKISEAKRGKTPNKIWSQAERDAMSARMSKLHKGKKLSEDHLRVLRARMTNLETKQDMINKVSAALVAKYENDPDFYRHIKETRVRGEASGSPFTELEVQQMRSEWETIDKTIRGNRRDGASPASKFCQKWAHVKNVSTQAVYAIVTRKTWCHLP